MPLGISGALWARASYLYIRVHPQPQRQTLTRVEFDKGLKDFGIHTLARFVGAHVLPSEDATDADDPAGEFLRAVRFGGDKGGLADRESGHIGLVNIETDPQHGIIGKGYDRRIKLRRDAFPGVPEFSKNDAVDWSAHIGLFKVGARFGKLRLGPSDGGLGAATIFVPRLRIHERELFRGAVVFGAGNLVHALIPFGFIAGNHVVVGEPAAAFRLFAR